MKYYFICERLTNDFMSIGSGYKREEFILECDSDGLKEMKERIETNNHKLLKIIKGTLVDFTNRLEISETNGRI